jgi:hypothetical protein
MRSRMSHADTNPHDEHEDTKTTKTFELANNSAEPLFQKRNVEVHQQSHAKPVAFRYDRT